MATLAATELARPAQERRGQIYVALAAVAWSTAGVLQRQLTVDIPTQLAGRAAFAAIVLFAWVAVAEHGRVVAACRSVGVAGVGVAVSIAFASGGFVAALNHTTVARVLFFLAIAPVLAAVLARIFLGEPITRRSGAAMAIAAAGVTLMLGAPGGGSLGGDVLCLLVALAFSVSIVITRHRRDVSMAPATALSQLILIAVFAPLASPGDIGGNDLWALALLGAGQIGLGLALMMIGARLIPTAQVALISLLEVVLGPIWVWLAYTEQPDTATLVGGAIVILAILVQIRGGPAGRPAVPSP